MYKLTVVSGLNRGTQYALGVGETILGRSSQCNVALPSNQVSKQHCSVTVEPVDTLEESKKDATTLPKIKVKDLGSSNGTFVNGALIVEKWVKPGDRISIGDFVLEVSSTLPATKVTPLSKGLVPALQFPGAPGTFGASSTADVGHSNELGLSSQAMPQDLKGKAFWYFDQFLMPFFYQQMMKKQWRVVALTLAGVFIFANLFVSVSPLVDANRKALVKEAAKRAQVIARQIADKNAPYLAAKTETKTEIGSLGREEQVRLAVLVDLDNRIMAPPARLNQYLLTGGEAFFAIKVREAFRQGREGGAWNQVSDEAVVAVEPVKVLDPTLGRNVIVAMAVVGIDISQITPDWGSIGMAYSEVLIITGLIGGLILLILYKLTLKPFQVLNDDIDQILKGNMGEVTHEFKFEELNTLWSNINSAMIRVPKSSGDGLNFSAGPQGPSVDEYFGALRTAASMNNSGVIALDSEKKIVMVNSQAEEVTGIRQDAALGKDIPSVARDQAFAHLANEMCDRVSGGSDGISEDFEFSGISYKVYLAAFGSQGGSIRCYCMFFNRNSEGG